MPQDRYTGKYKQQRSVHVGGGSSNHGKETKCSFLIHKLALIYRLAIAGIFSSY